MIGTITDDYGEYVYVDFPDRAKKGKNTEVSIKLSDLELLKENKMNESTQVKLKRLIERLIKEETQEFGNDNTLSPNQLKKGKSYLTSDGKIVKYTGESTDPNTWITKYHFSMNGRGNYAMTHDEVLDNVTNLSENKMKPSTQVKLKKLIERLIREESQEFGVRWSEFDRNDRIVKKEKVFTTKQALDKFKIALEKKDNFNKFEAWL